MDDTLMDMAPLAARGFCCSQILGLLTLRAQGRGNPEPLRALGGLCQGLGASRETGCGTRGILAGILAAHGLDASVGRDG